MIRLPIWADYLSKACPDGHILLVGPGYSKSGKVKPSETAIRYQDSRFWAWSWGARREEHLLTPDGHTFFAAESLRWQPYEPSLSVSFQGIEQCYKTQFYN